MKAKIHPKYMLCTVTCGCGNTFETMSTQKEVRVEICAACHPFFTGKQKFVDTAGRVQKFEARFNWSEDSASEAAAKRSAAAQKKERIRKPLPKATKPKGQKKAAKPVETMETIEAPELPAGSATPAPVAETPAAETPAPEAVAPEAPAAPETPAEPEQPAAGEA